MAQQHQKQDLSTLPHVFLTRSPTPLNNRRKFSFPINFHSTLLLGENNSLSTRRRLSNVSDVVTRKLSETIGWKYTSIPAQEIISQGKCLCGQYIKQRLKRAGIFNRKLGFQRIRSIIGTPSIHVVREVFQALNILGEELEKKHPRVYTNIARQISRESGGILETEDSASILLNAIARYLFKSNITWSKVIAFFSISGGLAVDCVRQNHPDYLPKLIEGVAEVIEDELVSWINENGGWPGINTHVKCVQTEFKVFEYSILVIGLIIGICLILFILKIIGFHVIPYIYSVT